MRTVSREQNVKRHLSNSLDADPRRLLGTRRSASALNHKHFLFVFGVDAEARTQLQQACCGRAVV